MEFYIHKAVYHPNGRQGTKEAKREILKKMTYSPRFTLNAE
jgi:hypothetical protein